MNLKDYVSSSVNEIDFQIESFFKTWRQEVGAVDAHLLPLIDASISANEGGKRLRGVLVKLGYEMVIADSGRARKTDNEILKPAAAFEIFQTAILAHDDIMDKSPLRRGKPTLYYALGGDHYGMSQTISLGDIGFFLAIKIISDTNFEAEYKSKAISNFTKAMVDTAFGQLLDMEIPSKNLAKTEEMALTIFRHKTARYTIVGPMQLGATLAGASDQTLEKIKQFGDNLGIAFQIQDDILGVFGVEGEVGKSVTSDIEEGKNTLLIIEALKKADPTQKQFLADHYGQGKISLEQLEKIRQIFIDTGSLEYSKQVALEYVTKAKKILPEVTKDEPFQDLLSQLADFLIKRSK